MTSLKQPLILAAALALAAPMTAWAVPLLITNPGFEADVAPPGAFLALLPGGWSLYDPAGVVNQSDNAVGVIRPLPGTEFFPAGTPEGNQAALLYLAGNSAVPVGLQQTLGATLQANTRYRLQVDVGNIASGTSLPGSSDGGGLFYDLAGFPGYRLELLAGNTLLAVDHNSVGALISDGSFREVDLVFDSGAAPAALGQALTIRLINLDLPGALGQPGIETDFDNVRLDAQVLSTVPEPATWVLLLLGVAWFRGAVARRRATST